MSDGGASGERCCTLDLYFTVKHTQLVPLPPITLQATDWQLSQSPLPLPPKPRAFALTLPALSLTAVAGLGEFGGGEACQRAPLPLPQANQHWHPRLVTQRYKLAKGGLMDACR